MIKSLQGLRAIGMLGIFAFHSGLLLKGTFPVTFFFILSGFVLYYSYNSKIDKFKLKENIKWIKYRMIKLYPIHIITFMMSIVIRWNWLIKFNTSDIIIKAILNISLLQSLSPKQTFPFNGLSWFLSTTFILYIVAVPIILMIKKLKNIDLRYVVFVVLVLQNFITIINNTQDLGLNLYTSPFFRVFDFGNGMLVAKYFINKNNEVKEYKNYNLYEIIIFLIFVVMYIISLLGTKGIEYGLSYYSPVFIMGIYILSYEKGVISKLLSCNMLQQIASFSFEFYMVHELILIMFRRFFANLNYHWVINSVIISIPAFIISIALAMLLNKCITKRKIFSLNEIIGVGSK